MKKGKGPHKRIHKKGTEKPIEIFVALFIILAVSMVMLKLFQGQITEKSTELKKIQKETELEQDKNDARLECKSQCTQSIEDECSMRARAIFCLKKVSGLDIDGDLALTGFDTNILGGIGVCEDGIYCPQIIECNCGQKLDMENCREVLCQYWNTQGIDAAQRDTMLQRSYHIGTCENDDDYDPDIMWDKIMLNGDLTCGSVAVGTGI
jgi:hypothetical protein